MGIVDARISTKVNRTRPADPISIFSKTSLIISKTRVNQKKSRF